MGIPAVCPARFSGDGGEEGNYRVSSEQVRGCFGFR